ncbi:class II aldolase/adducin family protein [Pelagibius sp.]|uniref:class II aldolase/adducin family protein n=1 Tax=Pelagibius sp. TaxID=1931238 RepID=UPI003BB1BC41
MLKSENQSRSVTPVRESIYQPEQQGLKFPQIPSFEMVDEERQHRKERLVAACRAFAEQGFSYGSAGHISVRDPENSDLYWTNPMAVHFAQVTMSSLVLANHEGKVVEGDYAINRAGFVLHAAVHRGNPDIVAMCHAHTPHGVAWCAMGRPLDPITQDACRFYGTHAVVNDEGGAVSVEAGQGAGVVEAFADNRAILHQNHGLITASRHSVDDAAWAFIALEAACRVQLLVEATGKRPTYVTPERAQHTVKHTGSEYIGWLHFQPVYANIVKTNPDMFD